MTKTVKLVIVMTWRYEIFEKMLFDFLKEGEPGDPKEMKRRRILGAASTLFIKYGYRKTSMEDVAKRAGVAKGTVYLYFKNKPELLAHAIGEEKKQYIGTMRAVLAPDKAPRERLKEWIRMVFVLGSEMPLTSKVLSGDQDILTAIFEFMDRHKEEKFAEMQLAFLCSLIEEAAGKGGLPKAETEARAKVLLGLAYFAGMASNPKIRSGLSLEQFAGRLAEMLVDGIKEA